MQRYGFNIPLRGTYDVLKDNIINLNKFEEYLKIKFLDSNDELLTVYQRVADGFIELHLRFIDRFFVQMVVIIDSDSAEHVADLLDKPYNNKLITQTINDFINMANRNFKSGPFKLQIPIAPEEFTLPTPFSGETEAVQFKQINSVSFKEML